jgi:hypothetical protein
MMPHGQMKVQIKLIGHQVVRPLRFEDFENS